MIWMVVLVMPLLAGLSWLLQRGERHGRGLLILDVPADVAVRVGGRDLRPCADEFEPAVSCSPVSAAARRYRWAVVRGQPIEVEGARAQAVAKHVVAVPVQGPTPRLILEVEPFSWKVSGGTRMDGKVAVFVDDAGAVTGPVGIPRD